MNKESCFMCQQPKYLVNDREKLHQGNPCTNVALGHFNFDFHDSNRQTESPITPRGLVCTALCLVDRSKAEVHTYTIWV